MWFLQRLIWDIKQKIVLIWAKHLRQTFLKSHSPAEGSFAEIIGKKLKARWFFRETCEKSQTLHEHNLSINLPKPNSSCTEEPFKEKTFSRKKLIFFPLFFRNSNGKLSNLKRRQNVGFVKTTFYVYRRTISNERVLLGKMINFFPIVFSGIWGEIFRSLNEDKMFGLWKPRVQSNFWKRTFLNYDFTIFFRHWNNKYRKLNETFSAGLSKLLFCEQRKKMEKHLVHPTKNWKISTDFGGFVNVMVLKSPACGSRGKYPRIILKPNIEYVFPCFPRQDFGLWRKNCGRVYFKVFLPVKK